MAKKSKRISIKCRRSWGPIKPVTKIKDSAKIYKRKNLTASEIEKYYGIE